MSGAVLTCRHPLFQGSGQRTHTLLIVAVAAVALVGCSRSSDAPTARFEVKQYTEEGAPAATFKGIGDFAAEEVSYKMFLRPEGEPWLERQEFGPAKSYHKDPDSDVWYESEVTTAQAVAVVSFRNNLAAATQALDYLSSVAGDVTEVGTDPVRGTDTVHYRATVDLTELGAPPEYDRYPVEVWVDGDGRTRRYRYHPIGSEETFVWEFFDFGVDVDLTPPRQDQIGALHAGAEVGSHRPYRPRRTRRRGDVPGGAIRQSHHVSPAGRMRADRSHGRHDAPWSTRIAGIMPARAGRGPARWNVRYSSVPSTPSSAPAVRPSILHQALRR